MAASLAQIDLRSVKQTYLHQADSEVLPPQFRLAY